MAGRDASLTIFRDVIMHKTVKIIYLIGTDKKLNKRSTLKILMKLLVSIKEPKAYAKASSHEYFEIIWKNKKYYNEAVYINYRGDISYKQGIHPNNNYYGRNVIEKLKKMGLGV